jgi:hypothetical protein
VTTIPKVGEVFEYETRPGYVLNQFRPFACRDRCVCGKCNGTKVIHSAIVRAVVPYADNSTEVELSDNTRHMVVPPHGDLCF